MKVNGEMIVEKGTVNIENVELNNVIVTGESTINSDAKSTIKDLEIKAKTTITGDVEIYEAYIDASDVKIENKPTYAEIEKGIESSIGGEDVTSSNDYPKRNTSNNKTTTSKVIYPETVSITNTNVKMDVGSNITLEAIILPESSTEIGLTWESSDENIASVNGGIVTAVSKGIVKITATTVNDKVCEIEIVVNNRNPKSLGLNDIVVTSGSAIEVVNLSENFYDEDGDDLTYSITPQLPSGIKLSDGKISGIAQTTQAAILYTVKADDGENIVEDNFSITIVDEPVASYKIEHYKQNGTGNAYTLAETQDLSDIVGHSVNGEAKEYVGFTENTSYYGRVTSGSVDEDNTLVLKYYYDRNMYNIRLNSNEGISGTTTEVTAAYMLDMPSIEAGKPTRDGYTFEGYYEKSDGTGNKYYNSNMTSAKEWDKVADTTLYAKWTIIEYSITYNIDEKYGFTPTINSYDIEDEFIIETTSAGTEFFKGWYDKEFTLAADQVYDGSKISKISKGTTGNIVLYASIATIEGEGTESEPFLINSHDDLAKIGSSDDGTSYGMDAYYVQTEDINFDTTGGLANHTPIGDKAIPFKGHYDGRGYSITGVIINEESYVAYVGFFGFIDQATIKNVALENCIVTGAGRAVGGLVGANDWADGDDDDTVIENCYVSGIISGGTTTSNYDTRSRVGGFIGRLGGSGIVNNCYFVGGVENNITISEDSFTGGFSGVMYDNGIINNSYSIVTSFETTTNIDPWSSGKFTSGLFGGNIGGSSVVENSFAYDTSSSGYGFKGSQTNSAVINRCYDNSDITQDNIKDELNFYNISLRTWNFDTNSAEEAYWKIVNDRPVLFLTDDDGNSSNDKQIGADLGNFPTN